MKPGFHSRKAHGGAEGGADLRGRARAHARARRGRRQAGRAATRGTATTVAALVVGLALAACGQAGGQDASQQEEAPSPAAAASVEPDTSDATAGSGAADPAEATTEPVEPRPGATVGVADSPLGRILVDGEGRTLYRFEQDTGGESTCYDACEANWPALAADGAPEPGDGLDAALLGTTERADGTAQVVYAGQPLYYFAADRQPGDVNGQGVGDVWHVIAPDGAAVTTDAGSSGPADY